ncbi:CRTAC1 family protein [Tautonia plasticadhaerens]|uniref:FG-GAP repeat protein n=1 Tax=Tautonia plasticadhaerens TaxID=2527974 RepID=A0A518H2M8_9BACT|nr:CRTAC1 family protein [Tautonia plasticadhaerens]QDV35098.1 FG-GAP repeat protein [Tautonia plasticadhaerens]
MDRPNPTRATIRAPWIAVVLLLLAQGCRRPPEPGPAGRVDRDAGPAEAESVVEGPALSPAERYLDVPPYGAELVDDSGFTLATTFMAPVADRGDLDQVAAAIRDRARRGIAEVERTLAKVDPDDPEGPQLVVKFRRELALLHLYEGDFAEADHQLGLAAEAAEDPLVPVGLRANLEALRAVAALRRGETENCVACVGPSSCLWPIAPEAVHLLPGGASEAVDRLSAYIEQRPEDLAMRWVLGIALTVLGRDPSGVLPLEPPALDTAIRRLDNVALPAGLLAGGPDMAGGSAFDDFDGDGLPDLFWTSYETDSGARLFLNEGDGTFSDASADAGLDGQILAVNCTHADFDNDGNLDVLLLRGGWENPAPLGLLRNLGGGRFEDVTRAAGLSGPIASQSAAWGDFDRDGHLDLFVCGESRGGSLESSNLFADVDSLDGDERSRLCRLYHNNGDGTFADVTDPAGVANGRYAKGAAWGDLDDDGLPDLYVSNMAAPNRLYRNNGDGTFTDLAPDLGAAGPRDGFSCGWLDFDNDGDLDVFATDYSGDLLDFVADRVDGPAPRRDPGFGNPGPDGFAQARLVGRSLPRLYRNNGDGTFTDLAPELGLDRVFLPMGSNFGDVDGDGYLDLYLATGRPGYSYLMPNVLLRNDRARRFVDATASSGTGHLQKGHGVSFADGDGDGDLDLFVQLGGAVPGDRSYNALFRNPGHGNRWVTLKLIGIRSNRSAIGARIRVDVREPGGSTRSIHRLVSGGSSFGGNSLAQTIGLGDAEAIESVTIRWPIAGAEPQVLRGVPIDQLTEIVEPAD